MPRRKKAETMEKFEAAEEESERESAEEATGALDIEQAQKDIKLGEFQLRPDSVLLIKKTTYKGDDRIDFRVWKNSPMYKGPTKQGFVLPISKLDDFIRMANGMKKKMETA
jgi:hypothetical protein